MENVKMKRFIECFLPSTACNMKCEYCYITQNKERVVKPIDLSKCEKMIGKALSKERLGGVCMINICAAGETLMPKEVISILHDILAQGHYVMLFTNGTLTERFKACCEFPEEYRSHLFFKFSFHYLELKKQNKLDTYFSNIKMVQEAGISFTVEITPDDSYIPYIPEMIEISRKNLGTLPHVTVARDERYRGYPFLSKLPHEEFIKTWSVFESELFRFKDSIFGIKRHEFCYAGEWSIVVDLQTGEYKQCYRAKRLGNLYADVNAPLHLCAVGHHCPEGHCYNGHAFLGFGLIPELDTPDYADQRNRVCEDGKQWLSEPMECFMRCKLREANQEQNRGQKFLTDIRSINCKQIIKDVLRIK